MSHYNIDFVNSIYSEEYIQNIKDDGFTYELPEKTLELINRISKMVGAPSYIKTPIFHKSNKRNVDYKNKRNKIIKPLTDEEWDTLRTFEETKMKKIREGVDKDIALIISHLNKLTNDTYEICYGEICEILDKLKDIANKEDMLLVCKNIFEISSSNKFYANIFAKLLADIIYKYPLMKETFKKNYDNFAEYFKEFEFIDPDEDYDGFCDVNLRNEKRRAYACCIAHLVNEGIISNITMIKHISSLMDDFYKIINEENKKYVSEQVIEIVSIMISVTYKNIINEEEFEEVVLDNINNIKNLKIRDYPSLTSKCIFKMMDLQDTINKSITLLRKNHVIDECKSFIKL
jgi:hypothetical protein